jgi:hypothetical protein
MILPGARGTSDFSQFVQQSRLETGTDHRHASGGRGGNCGSGGRAHPPREGRKPGVRRLHLPAQPSEAARSGLADAFQLGAHLPSAHGREADGHSLFCHRSESLLPPHGRLTFYPSIK